MAGRLEPIDAPASMTHAVKSVAVLGYGRFGHAFAQLCQAAGRQLRAFDPAAEVPAELARPTVAEAVREVDLVVVAVPIDRMRDTFAELSPLLAPPQIVIDVGSVKVHPAAWMEAAFGRRLPWVATHPLFGPASLARGERPLRVVVCPNPPHAAAVDAVRDFYRSLGCEIVARTPEVHDQEMALTHALTFFVAKGMLDAGVPPDARHAPPSFQGMARTIEAVRVDAGHLLAAMHVHNPYAAAARRRLLEVLGEVSLALSAQEQAPRALDSPPGELVIPDLGAHSPELLETRELIDEVDEEIVSLLARRAELARRAGRAKAERGLGVTDPGREARLLEARRRRAAELRLDPGSIEEIFQAILRFSRAIQRSDDGT